MGSGRFKSRFDAAKSRLAPRFDIVLSDYTSSIEEWRRAQREPKEKLPVLDEQQRKVAQKLGISEEAYARSVRAGEYGAKRMHDRASELGLLVDDILAESRKDSQVAAVIAEMFKGRWVVQVETPKGTVALAIPRELADDILDSGLNSEVRKLRSLVSEALASREVRK